MSNTDEKKSEKNNYDDMIRIGSHMVDLFRHFIEGYRRDEDGYIYHAGIVLIRTKKDFSEAIENKEALMIDANYMGTMSDSAAGDVFKSLGDAISKRSEGENNEND